MNAKPICELSSDTITLISLADSKLPGETLTWKEMSAAVGWDIKEKPHLIGTVKRRLLKDSGKVMSVISGVGYKILTDAEVVENELASDRNRRRRAARRSKEKASTVDLSRLTEVQRIRCLSEVTAAHVVIESSTEKSVSKIESSMNGALAPLALNKALDAMKNK